MTQLADDTRWLDATAQAQLVATGDVSAAELAEATIGSGGDHDAHS